MRLSGRTIVAREPAQLFALWADLERSTEYSAATLERRKVTSGPIGVGTRYHAIDRWPGRTITFTVEVTTFEPPRQMVATWSGPMSGGWEASFARADGGTELTFTTHMEPTGVVGALSPIMRPWAAWQLRQFMTAFRSWAEAQPEPAAGTIDAPADTTPVGTE